MAHRPASRMLSWLVDRIIRLRRARLTRAAGQSRFLASCLLVPLIGACTPAPEPGPPPVPPGIEPYEGACAASGGAPLIGRRRSAAAEVEAKRLTGAVVVRWIAPGDAVTQDFNTGRINIETDSRGRIVGFRCG